LDNDAIHGNCHFMTSPWIAFARGAGLQASLIVAIGAQNSYVLQQGLRRSQVLPIVLICAASDALLVAAGIGGAGALLGAAPVLLQVLRWAGAAYLTWFGLRALARALVADGRALAAASATTTTRAAAIATTLALTYLNPHVYLDTLVVVGTLGAREPGWLRYAFASGAIVTSIAWFFALGYGARLLSPLFARPLAWRVLDGTIGLMVLLIAASLLWSS
jgi:L-lysine exporter family protein LysE/ArgO